MCYFIFFISKETNIWNRRKGKVRLIEWDGRNSSLHHHARSDDLWAIFRPSRFVLVYLVLY